MTIGRFTQEKFLEHCLSRRSSLGCLLKEVFLPVFPIRGHRAILTQIVIEIELLLIFHYVDHHLQDALLDILSDTSEAEHFLEDLVSNLFWRYFGIQDVLLEESILSIHMRAIEKTISIDDFIPVVLANIVGVVIIFILDIIFVTLDVPLLDRPCRRQNLTDRGICLEPKSSILANDLLCTLLSCVSGLLLPPILVEGLLQAAELFIEVDKDVGA